MSLKEILDRTRAASEAKQPPAATATSLRAVEHLRQSGMLERIVKPGGAMPHFALPNQDALSVDSAALLARGPLVVTFYRGFW